MAGGFVSEANDITGELPYLIRIDLNSNPNTSLCCGFLCVWCFANVLRLHLSSEDTGEPLGNVERIG